MPFREPLQNEPLTNYDQEGMYELERGPQRGVNQNVPKRSKTGKTGFKKQISFMSKTLKRVKGYITTAGKGYFYFLVTTAILAMLPAMMVSILSFK